MKYIKNYNVGGFEDLGEEIFIIDKKEAFINFSSNEKSIMFMQIMELLKAFKNVYITRAFYLIDGKEEYHNEFNIYCGENYNYTFKDLHIITIEANNIEIFS